LKAIATPAHAPAANGRDDLAAIHAHVTGSATIHDTWPSLRVICTPAALMTHAAIKLRCVQAPGTARSTI
jgi:hypothetical protein